jgi:hypothetical protein
MGFDYTEALGHVSSAMDAYQPTITPGSTGNLIQNLQNWLPGNVLIQTQKRTADDLMGVTVVGDFADEWVVQGILEYVGQPREYTDYSNIPLSSFNQTYEYRTIVRFEEGLQTGFLEELRAGKNNINASRDKREAALTALDILRNAIAFFGYNNGLNRTYGLLNDPNLLPYITASNKAGGGTELANGTFREIQQDLQLWFSTLRIQSGGIINPMTQQLELGLPLQAIDYITSTSDQGNQSVKQWLDDAYPNVRLIGVPEFQNVNGGESVGYLFPATAVQDGSTDGGSTLNQFVIAMSRLVGSMQEVKTRKEDYIMATAGTMVKKPLYVVRMTGL